MSSDYKKSDVIKELIKENNYEKDRILFIDDRIKHIEDVSEIGVKCLIANEVKE